MDIKDRIKRLRESRNMSQAELANELGISNGLIAMYETGKRYPSRKRLEQIADYFNVSMDYLTGREIGSIYYLDPNVAQIAQELYDNKGMRMLMDASRNLSKDDLLLAISIVNRMANNGE